MPWQAADTGTIAQDDSGAFHVKQGDSWVAAPKGSVAQDAEGKYHFNTDSLAAPKDAAEPEKPGLGGELKNAALDIGGTVARGIGDVGQTVRRNIQAAHGDVIEPYDAPGSIGNKFAAPFQHPTTPVSDPTEGMGRLSQSAEFPTAHPPQDVKLPDTPAVNTIREDVAPPIAHMAAAGATAYGAYKGVGALADAADTGINAINNPSAAQAATLRATPQVTRLRADGYKITGADMDRAAGPPSPGAEKDVHGSTSTDPGTLDRVQRFNQAKVTQSMGQDVKLTNTRAIDPDEVKQRMSDEGQVYSQVGDAIGAGRKPTINLDHELSVAAPSASDPAATAANDALVQHYRDHFSANDFHGPDAVQSVRDLRNEGNLAMAGNDVNAQSLGKTKIGIANAIENEMMRQLPANAQDLKTQFPEARMQLAKLHELQAVTDGGQVNANKVLQLKRSGAPLTGAADAAANASDVAPESMKRSAGTPDIAPYAPTHTGLMRDAVNVARRGINKLPGVDQSTSAYQEAHYGPEGGTGATPPPSSAPKVSKIPPPLDLQSPPGAEPPMQREMPVEQGRPTHLNTAPPPFELEHPPGEPAFESAQRPLTTGTGREGGNPMKQADWDRQTLDEINRYKGEQVTSMTGPRSSEVSGARLQNPPPGSGVRVNRPQSPAEKIRAKLGEAMQ